MNDTDQPTVLELLERIKQLEEMDRSKTRSDRIFSRVLSKSTVVAGLSLASVLALSGSSFVSAAGGTTTTTTTTTTTDPSILNACYGTSTSNQGNLRYIGSSTSCKSGEAFINWNHAGATGPSGVTGPQGNPGPNGHDGATGPPGVTGNAGANGHDGATGPPGVTGHDGATGNDGANGHDGATGPPGPTGPAGLGNFHWVSSPFTVNLGSTNGSTGTATCDTGKAVIGGFTVPNGAVNSSSASILQNHATDDGTGWTVTVGYFPAPGGAGTASATVYAGCATVPS